MRLEKDSLGELEVPDEAYYGVQTVRCSGNYKIGNHTYNEFPEVIRAMAEIKSLRHHQQRNRCFESCQSRSYMQSGRRTDCR